MYYSIEEALEQKSELGNRIQGIDIQLGERGDLAQLPSTSEEDFRAYVKWRTSALHAKLQLSKNLAKTRTWIKEEKAKLANKRIEANGGPDSLIKELYYLVKHYISKYDINVEDVDQTLIDDTKIYLDLS